MIKFIIKVKRKLKRILLVIFNMSVFNINNERKRALKQFFSYSDQWKLIRTPRFQVNKIKFQNRPLEFTDSSSLLGMINEIFINKNYNFNSDSEYPYIIDGGANIGISILYFKTLFPKSIIEAIEADPKVFMSLSKNMKSFGYNDVVLHQRAIWTNNNVLTFQSDNSWGGFVGDSKETTQNVKEFKVKGLTLRELIVKKVDLLKLDIEGAETDVLMDAKELIVEHVEHVFFEWHSINGRQQLLGEILNYFGSNGFRYHIKEASARETPFTNKRQNIRMDSQLDCFLYKI